MTPLAPQTLAPPTQEPKLPRPVPIDQMQLFRLQGRLQLQTLQSLSKGSAQELDTKEKARFSEALNQVRHSLKESGQKAILITNKGKGEDPSSYFELWIREKELKLSQVNPSAKFETVYSFETQTLTVGNSPTTNHQDLEKFANKIMQISTDMLEDKADVMGRPE